MGKQQQQQQQFSNLTDLLPGDGENSGLLDEAEDQHVVHLRSPPQSPHTLYKAINQYHSWFYFIPLPNLKNFNEEKAHCPSSVDPVSYFS